MKRFFEVFTDRCVDDEVNGCIYDQEGVIDTRQTQVPVWRHEVIRALNDLVHKEELCAVEDDPGDVADEEHRDDAD